MENLCCLCTGKATETLKSLSEREKKFSYFQTWVILWVRNVLKCSVKCLTKWSSWTRMARDYFEEVLRANYKKFIKNNWFFVFHTERTSSISSIKNSSRASSSATFFEHIPSRAKTERNFFRAFRARALFERANFRASRADFRASGARTQHYIGFYHLLVNRRSDDHFLRSDGHLRSDHHF